MTMNLSVPNPVNPLGISPKDIAIIVGVLSVVAIISFIIFKMLWNKRKIEGLREEIEEAKRKKESVEKDKIDSNVHVALDGEKEEVKKKVNAKISDLEDQNNEYKKRYKELQEQIKEIEDRNIALAAQVKTNAEKVELAKIKKETRKLKAEVDKSVEEFVNQIMKVREQFNIAKDAQLTPKELQWIALQVEMKHGLIMENPGIKDRASHKVRKAVYLMLYGEEAVESFDKDISGFITRLAAKFHTPLAKAGNAIDKGLDELYQGTGGEETLKALNMMGPSGQQAGLGIALICLATHLKNHVKRKIEKKDVNKMMKGVQDAIDQHSFKEQEYDKVLQDEIDKSVEELLKQAPSVTTSNPFSDENITYIDEGDVENPFNVQNKGQVDDNDLEDRLLQNRLPDVPENAPGHDPNVDKNPNARRISVAGLGKTREKIALTDPAYKS